ncbi:hypothetical protein ACFPT7_00440 [Acidicapsa dinghuensis]|uniref:Uncharacterized protein n=1 Tax=Acidicapsa dinghuensis TaxID=2218256 RepID=A0ABW1E8W2_9BACT|nr:hypothetical protein [Acidicapsa dinghuensis]
MLLVSFHGGAGGIGNVYAYDTSSAPPTLNSKKALQGVTLTNPELRGLVSANSMLYVVNGAKGASNIVCFTLPGKTDQKYHFGYVGEFLGPSLDAKGKFQNAIGHPYALLFAASQDGSGTNCYVANQDTNVVAQAAVSGKGKSAKIAKGWVSAYLKGLTGICPKNGCVFLDGTFAASQNGALPDVATAATNVPEANGGLAVEFAKATGTDADVTGKSKPKVQNSVRDLAVSNGVLLVCDEPAKVIRIYSLADGTYQGASKALAAGPTHLAIFNGGLFVSAGDQLYWSALANPVTPGGLVFASVLTAPAGFKVGGVTFDEKTNTAYVAFQQGTGTTGTGSIYSYGLGTKAVLPPVFGAGTVVASGFADTPEFLLFVD